MYKSSFFKNTGLPTNSFSHKADPKLARQKDEDGRLAIHWAASSNQPEIVSLLVNQKGFDPDVQVCDGLNSQFLR